MIKAGIDKEAVVKAVAGHWDDWKQARHDKEKIWDECLGNYLVTIDESKYENWPWRCKAGDTFSQETADTIASGLHNSLFPVNEEFYSIEGDDDLGKAGALAFKEHLDTQLHKNRFIERLKPWTKQISVIGNAPLLLDWSTIETARRRRIKQVNVATKESEIKTIDERQTRYDGPSLQVLDAYDVVFKPSVLLFSNTPFIRRTKVPRDIAKKLYKDVDLSALDEKAKSAPQENSDQMKVARAALYGVKLESLTGDEDDDSVEVLELHGDFVLDGERHEDQVIAVLNRTVLARFERNPFWAGRQIQWGTYDDLWFTLFGKGPLEPVRGTQQLIDTFSCQKADILNLIINGCFAYVDDGVIDPETLVLRPRGGIEVGNIANIKELHPNQNVALTYQEIEMLRARGERSTGASRFDMGQAPGGRRTAFEASMIGRGSSGRSIDVTKHLANDVMEEILEFYIVSNQQFLWDRAVLPNEVLLGQYHANFLGADLTAMRQFDLQNMMMFMDMIGRYPPLAEAANMPEVLQEIGRLFAFKNKNIVKPMKQYLAEQQQKQLMEQQAAQQGGGPRPQMGPQPVSEDQAMQLAGA